MKVFVSWSGNLSRKVAQELKKWIPCILQSVEVFYSAEDIEKGENWDSKIATELAECNYGIVCLTSENTYAPWINFEAGAIAKTLESRVSALMIDIKTSEIQGPLKRYQATKLEKEDIYQLITEINKSTENPLAPEILDSTFNAIWDKMYEAIKKSIDEYVPTVVEKKKEETIRDSEVVEEILQLVRKQNVLLGSPEQLLPPDYFEMLQRRYGKSQDDDMFYSELLSCTERVINRLDEVRGIIEQDDEIKSILKHTSVLTFIEIVLRMRGERVYNNPRVRRHLVALQEKYIEWRNIIE